MRTLRAIRVTAWVAAVLTFGLIVLGALVRSTVSGLSCPDWPTCYGHWLLTPAEFAALPTTGYTYGQVMLEWTHRLIAGTLLGPVILLLAILALVRRAERPILARAALLLVLLLVVQAGLGGLTVLDQNSPWTVAVHLTNALFVLTVILFIAVRSAEEPAGAVPWVARLAALAWITALLAIASAAMMAKSGASLACSTWPSCDGAVVPDLGDPLIRINFAHRALAAMSGVLVLLTAFVAWPSRLRGHALIALLLVAGQIGLGALVVILEVPTWEAMLHQAVGVLTFAVLTALLWRARAPAAPVRLAPTIGESHGLALRGA